MPCQPANRTHPAPRPTAVSRFNGKSFDSPLLAARYRLGGKPDLFQPLHHVDLLHPTRRAFAGRWENCRLQTAERKLLGFTRVDDLPGAEAPEAWFHWLRLGITERLPALSASSTPPDAAAAKDNRPLGCPNTV